MKIWESVQISGNSNGRRTPYTPSIQRHYLETAILPRLRFNPMICGIRATWPRAHGSNRP